MGKDYYGLLGVSKSATDAELKKAYRTAALKNHPDRGGDTKKFQDISEAFEALSDSQKRTIYDQFGEEGLKGGVPPGAGSDNPFAGGGGFPGGAFSSFGGGATGAGFSFTPSDPNDLFSRLFGGGAGGSPFASFASAGGPPGTSGMRFSTSGMNGSDDDVFSGLGGMPGSARRSKSTAEESEGPTKEIIKPMPVTLEDLYTGVTKKMKLTRKLMSGGSEEKILEVPIKAGFKAGTKIRFKGAGNEELSRSGRVQSQDVVFLVEEKPHHMFKRDGDNVIYTLKVPLVEALAGPLDASQARKSITSLDKRLVQYTVPYPDVTTGGAPLQPGQEILIRNEGFPITRASSTKKKGDMKVVIEVLLPTRLSAEQVQGVRRCLS